MLSAGQLHNRYDEKVSSQTLDQWTKNNKLLTDKRIDNKYNKCNYNNNNNNKIWSFIKHSNERNLFFMHNCAEILKNCRKKLNFKRIS